MNWSCISQLTPFSYLKLEIHQNDVYGSYSETQTKYIACEKTAYHYIGKKDRQWQFGNMNSFLAVYPRGLSDKNNFSISLKRFIFEECRSFEKQTRVINSHLFETDNSHILVSETMWITERKVNSPIFQNVIYPITIIMHRHVKTNDLGSWLIFHEPCVRTITKILGKIQVRNDCADIMALRRKKYLVSAANKCHHSSNKHAE